MSSVLMQVDFAMSWYKAKFTGRTAEDLAAVRRLIETVVTRTVFDTQQALLKGAERGINQATALIQDPNYYERKQARYKKKRQESAAQRSAERKARFEKQVLGPTDEEMRMKRLRIERDLIWHRKEIERCEQELKTLPDLKNIVTFNGTKQ